MREIDLTQGYVALVDEEDFEHLSKIPWSPLVRYRADGSKRVYVVAYVGGRRVRMHRLILGAPAHLLVDHRDGNPLNNRRANLRLCTHHENVRNVRVINAKSGFKGVRFTVDRRQQRSRCKPWRATIAHNHKKIFLGQYSSAEEAADAYDRKAIELFGEFAATNADLISKGVAGSR